MKFPLTLEDLPFSREVGRPTDAFFDAMTSLGRFDSGEFTYDGFMQAANLFWPTILSYRGAYFLQSRFDAKNADEWFDRGTGLSAIERVLNHCHLWDLFQEIPEEDSLSAAGHNMAITWLVVASLQYPDVPFVTDFRDEPDDYGPTTYLWVRRRT